MTQTSDTLYKERLRRIKDAIELREPDRVPLTPFFTFFTAKYAGMTFQEVMYDLDKLESGLEKLLLDFEPDAYPDTYRVLAWAPALELLDYKQLVWPGHGLGPNRTYQFIEGEYMMAEEYDDFLFDPTGFLLTTIFPRIWGSLKAFESLPPVYSAYYTRMLPFAATFGNPSMIEAVSSLMKAGAESRKILERAGAFSKRMAEQGFPPIFGSAVNAPFDYIGDYLRGTRGIMLDMYRCPDKLQKALEKVYQFMLRNALAAPKLPDIHLVFIPLHKGLDGFMSLDQFKTFFWPTLKKLMLDLIEAGFTPCPLWEGKCDSRLETIADMPKGKAVYWFEQTDIFKAKEILGDRICLRGNVPASLLNLGTPQQVEDYCKKLIDIV
ncbi:MAG: uroporphyrinogen decarboxylase family protein, partial [Nitrospirales bacterium]